VGGVRTQGLRCAKERRTHNLLNKIAATLEITTKSNMLLLAATLESLYLGVNITCSIIVLKVGSALGKKSLEGLFVSLIGAGLVYFVGLGLLSCVEKINLLLEGYNLGHYILGIIIITNTRGG
jgi:hypothetical protein